MDADVTAKWGPRENWRIMKNVVVLSAAFMVQFTAVNGASNLQSSINIDKGLGTASLAALYAAVLVSSLFLPVVLIKWLDTKWTMVCCFSAYMPYMVAQLRPTSLTLIPAGQEAGLVASPMWCAACTYITVISEAHSKISKTSKKVYIARYLGIFFMVFHFNQVWGNIVSSVVLLSGDNEAAVTSMNASQIPELCGANFLPSSDAGKALLPQPPEKIQLIVGKNIIAFIICIELTFGVAGIYLACIAGAMLITAFGVDCPKRYKSKNSKEGQSSLSLLLSTTKLIVEPNQLLLVLISVFLGIQQAFVVADLTVSFVSCAIGPGTVGYVMMANGLASAAGCFIVELLVKIIGRVRLIVCTLLLNSALYAFMLMWHPQPGVIYVHYVIAIVAGICNSVWLLQINAFYGIIFPGREEPAFAAFVLFEAVGFIIAFAISSYLRNIFKIYLFFTVMWFGCIGYFLVEYRLKKSTKRTLNITTDIAVVTDIKGYNNNAYQG